MNITEFAPYQPGGGIEPLQGDDHFHQQNVDRVVTVDVGTLVRQQGRVVKVVVPAGEDNCVPPREGWHIIGTDGDVGTIGLHMMFAMADKTMNPENINCRMYQFCSHADDIADEQPSKDTIHS